MVDDGSTDESARWARSALAACPISGRLIQFDHNRGKRWALAEGFRHARGSVVATIDSDTFVERSTLKRLVSPLQADAKLGAVAGCLRPRRNTSVLSRLLEAAFALNFDWERAIQSRLGCVFCTPGAITAYRMQAVRGVLPDWSGEEGHCRGRSRIGEDRELTNRVLAAGWTTTYQSSAQARTRVPCTLVGLWRMYVRWGRGDVRETARYAGSILMRPRAHRMRIDAWCIVLLAERWAVYLALFAAAILIAQSTNAVMLLGGGLVVGALPAVVWMKWRGMGKAALYLPLYALFWVLLCSWIGPWSLLTPHRDQWLTRHASAGERRNGRFYLSFAWLARARALTSDAGS